ncbi:MAG: GMC family oxidoreductase [Acidobacteriota bacterium]
MTTKVYDAIVVGSGATGGWSAKVMTEAGMEVLMLEAGEPFDESKDYREHTLPHDLPLRGRPDPRNELLQRRPVQTYCYACTEINADFFIDDIDNPYTTAPGKPFNWIQGNKVGGRSLMWARQSYRMSDYDFKAASRDGYGMDWPISYSQLEPYYDRVEEYIGVSGKREGLDVLPDGKFLPPMPFSCGEQKLADTLKDQFGVPMTIGRTAVLTESRKGRLACHYCGPCHYGCRTRSYFNSPQTTLKDCEATGRFTLVPNAMVEKVTTDAENLADGVTYFDKTTDERHEVRAKVVVLCASTLASTRILLNSADGGLANDSDVLGRYVMDHIYATGVGGRLPERDGVRPQNANRPNGVYVPRFQNLADPKTHNKDYLRGYGYQGGEGLTAWEHALYLKGFGAAFKDAIPDGNTARLSLGGFGEILPRADNRVVLDDEVVDRWGVPVLRMQCSLGSNELAMVDDMLQRGAEFLEAAGVKDIQVADEPAPMGSGIHEVGTARMGDDPKTSYLNEFQQSHEINNLFVMDGASYVSIGCVNPTLTMMSLALRSTEYLVEAAKRGDLA